MRQRNKVKNMLRLPFKVWFWILFIAIMSILFFYNRKSIKKTVTKIKEGIELEKPKIINSDIKKIVEGNNKKNENIKDANENITKEEDNSLSIDDKIENESKNEGIDSIIEEPKENNEELAKNEKDVARENEGADTNNETEKRDICVYFATVNTDGVVSREKCVRSINRSPSPMVDSIKTLLEGPTKDEAKKGFRSFIPPDTKLLSASIKDGLAMIDFNEDFQFNRYGVEGYNIQLQQVVFTVCSFPSVNSVQFLIEGQKRDFLGSDGVWIGSPFTIDSF